MVDFSFLKHASPGKSNSKNRSTPADVQSEITIFVSESKACNHAKDFFCFQTWYQLQGGDITKLEAMKFFGAPTELVFGCA